MTWDSPGLYYSNSPLQNRPHPCQITRQHVDFDIDLLALGQCGKGGYRPCVRDDVEREVRSTPRLILNRVDGERNAVNRYRTLGRDIGGDVAGDFDDDMVRPADFAHAHHAAYAVNMARYDMAAQLITDLECAFKVEDAPLCPHAVRGFADAFARNIDREPVRPFAHHGQASARTGNRRTHRNAAHVIAAANGKPRIAACLDTVDCANIGDYACEHLKPFTSTPPHDPE